MNTEKREYAHPAFVRMIDEMNEMDAKVLKKIVDISDSIPVARVTFTFEGKYLAHVMPHFIVCILTVSETNMISHEV